MKLDGRREGCKHLWSATAAGNESHSLVRPEPKCAPTAARSAVEGKADSLCSRVLFPGVTHRYKMLKEFGANDENL